MQWWQLFVLSLVAGYGGGVCIWHLARETPALHVIWGGLTVAAAALTIAQTVEQIRGSAQPPKTPKRRASPEPEPESTPEPDPGVRRSSRLRQRQSRDE